MSQAGSSSCGVAILFGKGVDCVIHAKILDPFGRYIIFKTAINEKIYILINVYAPYWQRFKMKMWTTRRILLWVAISIVPLIHSSIRTAES